MLSTPRPSVRLQEESAADMPPASSSSEPNSTSNRGRLKDRSDRDCGQASDEAAKHRNQQGSDARRGRAKFSPDENAPGCRDHRRTLADGVRNGRPDEVDLRRNEVQRSTAGPDDAAENSSEMPGHWSGGESTHGDGRAAIDRLTHEEIVERHCANRHAEDEEKCQMHKVPARSLLP